MRSSAQPTLGSRRVPVLGPLPEQAAAATSRSSAGSPQRRNPPGVVAWPSQAGQRRRKEREGNVRHQNGYSTCLFSIVVTVSLRDAMQLACSDPGRGFSAIAQLAAA